MRRRRRKDPHWYPPGMGADFWERKKFHSEGVMANFDRSPAYIQEHIRKFDTAKGAKEPPPSLLSAIRDIQAVIGWSADAAGIRDWKVDIDAPRDIITLTINGTLIDLFTRQEIEDMSYRSSCAGRVRRALENFT